MCASYMVMMGKVLLLCQQSINIYPCSPWSAALTRRGNLTARGRDLSLINHPCCLGYEGDEVTLYTSHLDTQKKKLERTCITPVTTSSTIWLFLSPPPVNDMEPVVSHVIAFSGVSNKASRKRALARIICCGTLIAKVPGNLTLRMSSIHDHRGIEDHINYTCEVKVNDYGTLLQLHTIINVGALLVYVPSSMFPVPFP